MLSEELLKRGATACMAGRDPKKVALAADTVEKHLFDTGGEK